MYNEKTNELEQKLKKVFGEKATLAITNAKLGNRGYMVRIESQGIPYTVDSFKENNEEAEQLAIEEFERRMNESLEENVFPTQPIDCYRNKNLSTEEMNKLYKYIEFPISSTLKDIEEKTTALVCCLNNNKYECVITGPYMNLNARGVGATERIAVMNAINTAHNILNPFLVKVGNWPITK